MWAAVLTRLPASQARRLAAACCGDVGGGGGGGGGGRRGLASAAAGPPPGLFGLPQLQRPGDFEAWARDATRGGRELVARVAAAPPDVRAVRLLDDLSNGLCGVYDAAECCRCAATPSYSPLLRRAISPAGPRHTPR